MCLKEVMVEMKMVGLEVIELRSGKEGFYKEGVEVVWGIEMIGVGVMGSI